MSKLPKCCGDCGFFANGALCKCLHDDITDMLEIIDINKVPTFCPLKEDELDAKRFKVQYRGENFYLCIAEHPERVGKPWEIFVEHAINGKSELQFMMSSWDTATRFISRDLKREPLESTLRQLDKASRQKDDLPHIIAATLRRWV